MKKMSAAELAMVAGDAKTILIAQFLLYIRRNYPSVSFSENKDQNIKVSKIISRAVSIKTKKEILNKKTLSSNSNTFSDIF